MFFFRSQTLNPALFLLFSLVVSPFLFAGNAETEQPEWPVKLEVENGDVITIYQPHIESMDGHNLTSRAAISFKAKGEKPVFGAMWTKHEIRTDRNARIVYLVSGEVTDLRVPEIEKEETFTEIKTTVDTAIYAHTMELSLDHILASLESDSGQKKLDESLKHDAPKILYRETPAVLILIDGKPIKRDIPGTSLQTVVNTPFFLLYDTRHHQYWLYGMQEWFRTKHLDEPWTKDMNAPAEARQILHEEQEAARKQQQAGPGGEQGFATSNPVGTPPEIVVSQEPAELIVVEGEPEYKMTEGANLLYVENSTSNLILDIESQYIYLLISGRWYRSKDLKNGPWSFVNPNNLPAEFAKIKEGSEKDIVLASVPGTEAAREAILDAQIPQTAEIDRKSAKAEVEYDGHPKFEQIPNTEVYQAINTDKTVLRIQDHYYLCDNGVWFDASKPKGPWQVSVEIPEQEIDQIPPSSAAYNAKYVKIYESTPDVVYVGYTPGYVGSYIAGPVVVYGTGYYYNPWYGSYYYPRPVTWGFHMHYNPWHGWSMGWSVTTYGPNYWFGWSTYPGWGGGWWGPPIYRPPVYYHYPHYYGRHNPRQSYYRPRPSTYGSNTRYNQNLYSRNRRPGVRTSRPTTRPSASRPSSGRPAVRPSSGGRNNVYSDRQGNVYRRQGNNWKQRQNGSWSRPSGSGGSRPSGSGRYNRPSSGNSGRSSRPSGGYNRSSYNSQHLNRMHSSRQRSSYRNNSYNSRPPASHMPSSRSYGRSSYGGGGRSYGGRRR